ADTVYTVIDFTGYPVIEPSDSCLDYDTVMQYSYNQQLLTITNAGCDTLFVTDIVSSNADFSVDTTSLTLLPNMEYDVTVSFTPSIGGE
ncbi:MAG: hypothetical protein MI749_21435, partial [Desulfovibrionales bacterium]|nr:hypothetical protein [Desulfovibrionales bacterium]